MENHPIRALMETAMQSIKEMVDVNTVVGDAVETQDGTVIVPVSKVSVGFVAGGGDYAVNGNQGGTHPFAGGSGAGVTVQPVGFLVVTADSVRLLPVTEGALYDRLIDLAPELLDRLLGWNGGIDGSIGTNGDPASNRKQQSGDSIEPVTSDPTGTGWTGH